MLTNDNKAILQLSRIALFDLEWSDLGFTPDWNALWDKCQAQNITGLIASAVLKMPESDLPENVSDWKTTMLQTIAVMANKNKEFSNLAKALSDKGITPLCLKGCVVKDLYPVPELRTMGDFDILVEKQQRKDAEHILISIGYEIKKDTLFTALDKGKVHGELFFSLEDDFRIEPEKWDNELKSHVYKKENKLFLNPTYEFAYSIIHAAKHLLREGCGIRNLFDVVLLLKKHSDIIDFKAVEKMCMAQGYEKVLYYMVTAAEQWYDIKLKTDITRTEPSKTEAFLTYLLEYGIFGRSIDGNVLSTQVARREGSTVSTFRRIFFPPKQMIWHKYQYLKKTSLLLPVAWVHRLISAVFVKKYSIINMIKGVNESIDYSNEREKWLDVLELK